MMAKDHHWRLVGFVLLAFAACTLSLQGETILPVRGKAGMVVAGHPEAVEIGLQVLRDGGSAMDAAVATGFALGVAEPYGSGIGGKCAILYFEAASGQTWYVDGLDAAGAGLDAEALNAASSIERAQGGLGVGVPGMVAALELGHSRWGILAWERLLLPSADLAGKGFRIEKGMPVFFERRRERILSNDETRRIYMPQGGIPEVGSRLVNEDLARTIRIIAEQGRDGFYDGEIAAAIVNAVRQGGGLLTLEDFRSYRAGLREPLSIDWQGYRITSSAPPVKGGATVLLAMKLLEDYPWPQRESIHQLNNMDICSRVFLHVYPLIEETMGDRPEALSNWRRLTDEAHLEKLRQVVFSEPEPPLTVLPGTREEGIDECTTHFVVADEYGNVASVTQSLSHHFGSGVIAPGTGVILNNTLKNFSTWDDPALNGPAPGKRPTSTIAPSLVFRGDRPVLAIGLPGGQRIPTTLVQVLVDHLSFASGLGAAIAAPRFHLQRNWQENTVSELIQLEEALAETDRQTLERLGWQVEVPADSEYFGGITAIEIDPAGTLTGWADFRRTNVAAGF